MLRPIGHNRLHSRRLGQVNSFPLLVENPVASKDAAFVQMDEDRVEQDVHELAHIDVNCEEGPLAPSGTLDATLLIFHLDEVAGHIWQRGNLSLKVQVGE